LAYRIGETIESKEALRDDYPRAESDANDSRAGRSEGSRVERLEMRNWTDMTDRRTNEK
jgi:hypothetical protein